MSITPGTNLGLYEIVAAIGAGGMGEVYRARDKKLGREVAIKVLPEEFTQHPQKLARFEREARLLASLNHPGIATLHGLENFEGKPFLVMELVEGQTLADRISLGPIPVGEALEISRQIAEALEAAHEKGVIHRDLKPSNIKIDPEGKVKVLDFGLAKAFGEEVPESELSQSPTLSRDATRAGVILGTAAYMSPEQARGKAVDKRTDIFSFGMVLFEMLTGKRAFKGEDVSDLLASIMKLEPDWKALPEEVPPSVTKLLRRCLTKDRKNRLRDIGDVRFEIQEILTAPVGAAAQRLAVSGPNRVRETVAWGLAILAAIVAGIAVWSATRLTPPPLTRFAVTLPATDQLVLSSGIALSPDGRDLVYAATRGGVTQLYRRSIDALEAVVVRGTEGGTNPFFSPDGEWVGFLAEGQLKKVPIAGGPAVTVYDGFGPGGSWRADGVIAFASTAAPPVLLRASALGGAPEPLTQLQAGEIWHGYPWFLPRSQALLFQIWFGTGDTAQLAVLSLKTGERKMLLQGRSPSYTSTGHIVFLRAESLWAAPFDSDRLEVVGEPTRLVEGVQGFALAEDGSLAYVPGGAARGTRFVWVDREGREEPVLAEPQDYEEFSLSREGTLLAVRVSAETDDLWVYDLLRDTSTRLTFDSAAERFPRWTPDGLKVAFGGPNGMLWKSADGTGDAEPILEDSSNQRPEAFSPDGRLLVYQDLTSGRDLGMVSLEGETFSTILLDSEFEERNAVLSPDGQWMAYESNESGLYEVYVRPFPDVHAGKWQVSNDIGAWPLWAPDGREIFYLSRREMKVVGVSVETEPTFALGRREPLFNVAPYVLGNARRMAISPDSQRFLLLKSTEADDPYRTSIVVVQNWFEELKRLVPTN